MRASILFFSPSGNTRGVAEGVAAELRGRGWDCGLVDATGRADELTGEAGRLRLESELGRSDVVLVGGPVYAHHMHYTVLDLIAALPAPRSGREPAVVFATYGGVSSGVALSEGGRALEKGGRRVVAGLKVAAPHRMTRAFMDRELNADIGPEAARAEIAKLADKLDRLQSGAVPRSALRRLSCNGPEAAFKARFIFQERKWHETRYPRPEVDASLCVGCGACVRSCPVKRFIIDAEGKASVGAAPCIHCMNCAVDCPAGAIRLVGDMEKGRALLKHMIEHHANRELPATAVYPIDR